VPTAWDEEVPADEPGDDDGDAPRAGRSKDAPERVAGAVRVTAMRRRHLRSVVHIEEECYPRPWSATVFLSELAQRSSRRYTVATIGPLVVGFSGLMVVQEDGHITTLTVDPAWHHRGIGTVLLLDQARAAPGLDVRNLTLEVRASNASAQALYRRFGFAPVGIRRNYYAETGEDAIVMWARDVDGAPYAERLAAIDANLREEA
jgi:[ribosomal protein S18]-alanine N-acetyltransferase